MAANIYDWSLVAANNGNSDADLTWAEGQAPSTVNNAARVMMQREKQFLVDIGGSIAAGGTANGLTVTAASPFAAYADGMIISFRATASNTAAATLSVNGIGAKAIRKMATTGDVALSANDIRNTGIYVAQYSAALNGAAGAWLLVNPTLYIPPPPTFQVFSANGTWTNPGCRFADFEAVGGGGGSGASDGTAVASTNVTGGGGSGFYGRTGLISVVGVVSAAVTIGAAGAAGATPSGAGGNGGNTAITINATTYTWGGGTGSFGRVGTTNTYANAPGGAGGVGTNVVGGSQHGGFGAFSHLDNNALSGAGGSTPLGTGGASRFSITIPTAQAGLAGAGFGAGGGGALNIQTNADQAGAAGTAGYMRVWEYY